MSDFSRKSFKKYVWNFTKIRRMGAESFYADGQTEMTKLLVAFRNGANALKNRLKFKTIRKA
jgi:hypothetical protein